MRIIASLLIAAVPMMLFGQKKTDPVWPEINVDASTNLITYTDVPEVAGVSASDLYDRAYDWVSTYYKNPSEKIRKAEKESGEIEVFSRFHVFAYDQKGVKTDSRQGLVQYTLTFRFRDGRYKYEITNFNLKGTSYQALEFWLDRDDPNARNHAYYLMDVEAEMKATISSFKDAISAAPEKKSDDW